MGRYLVSLHHTLCWKFLFKYILFVFFPVNAVFGLVHAFANRAVWVVNVKQVKLSLNLYAI